MFDGSNNSISDNSQALEDSIQQEELNLISILLEFLKEHS